MTSKYRRVPGSPGLEEAVDSFVNEPEFSGPKRRLKQSERMTETPRMTSPQQYTRVEPGSLDHILPRGGGIPTVGGSDGPGRSARRKR